MKVQYKYIQSDGWCSLKSLIKSIHQRDKILVNISLLISNIRHNANRRRVVWRLYQVIIMKAMSERSHKRKQELSVDAICWASVDPTGCGVVDVPPWFALYIGETSSLLQRSVVQVHISNIWLFIPWFVVFEQPPFTRTASFVYTLLTWHWANVDRAFT